MKVVKTLARPFITITPDWEGDIPEGAFVRFAPGPNDSDLTIKQKREMFEAMGAVVKVLPRKTAAAPVAVFTRVNNIAPKETVIQLVQQGNIQDRASVLKICEDIMNDNQG